MENIFENAFFGKTYKTRDGRKAIYHHYDDNYNLHALEVYGGRLWVDNEGFRDDELLEENPDDIVSEWLEEVNEAELDKLAEECNPYLPYDKSDICVAHAHDGFNEGFEAGYRKALNL